jgi:hypothetical protein
MVHFQEHLAGARTWYRSLLHHDFAGPPVDSSRHHLGQFDHDATSPNRIPIRAVRHRTDI